MRAILNAIREAIARAQLQLALLKEQDAAEQSLPTLDGLKADLIQAMRRLKEIEAQIANDPRYLHTGLRLQNPD